MEKDFWTFFICVFLIIVTISVCFERIFWYLNDIKNKRNWEVSDFYYTEWFKIAEQYIAANLFILHPHNINEICKAVWTREEISKSKQELIMDNFVHDYEWYDKVMAWNETRKPLKEQIKNKRNITCPK